MARARAILIIMNSATVEATTKAMVERMGVGGARIGIRELALAVEDALPGVTLDEIHAAAKRVAAFFPSDDPQCASAKRQEAFACHQGPHFSPLVWVYRKG